MVVPAEEHEVRAVQLNVDQGRVLLAQWVYSHRGDSMGHALLNIFGQAVLPVLEPYVQETGPHKFIPAGVLAAWVCGRPLPSVETHGRG